MAQSHSLALSLYLSPSLVDRTPAVVLVHRVLEERALVVILVHRVLEDRALMVTPLHSILTGSVSGRGIQALALVGSLSGTLSVPIVSPERVMSLGQRAVEVYLSVQVVGLVCLSGVSSVEIV